MSKHVILIHHTGRGSKFYPKLYNVTECKELFRLSTEEAETLFKGNMDINTDDVYCYGFVDISPDDRWLVLFDPTSEAGSKGECCLIKDGEDVDQYVIDNCMYDNFRHTEEWLDADGWLDTDALETHLKRCGAPVKPLDWCCGKTYCCIKEKYTSEFWGWADGHNEDEPFLVDFSAGYSGYGIMRLDLHNM